MYTSGNQHVIILARRYIFNFMKNVELENRPIDRGPGGSMS